MVALYLTSVEAAGKTALCAGVGKKILDSGIKVGFLAPIQLSEPASTDSYSDISFIKDVLSLEDSVELLSPIRLSQQELQQSLADKTQNFANRITQAYARISKGKDIVLMEGLSNFGIDDVSTQACYKISDTLEARVIVVLRYSPDLTPARIVQLTSGLEKRLLGVVVNFVPQSNIEMVQEMAKSLQQDGINTLGILPQIRSLLGVSVSELVEILDGEVLTCPEKTGELVENIMLGAMTPDSGIDYFRRKANKAAVIRGERADMQLAALETSTKCLVLPNKARPLPTIVHEAEDKAVPIIAVEQDTSSIVNSIEMALSRAKFNSQQKLQEFEDVLDCYFDFNTLYSALGLKT